MKIKISLAFFSIYMVSLVLTAPASLITRFIPDNTGLQIGNISGSLWNGKLAQLDYRNQFQLQRLTWKFDWLALLTLKAKADVKFSNSRNAMTGAGSIAYGLSGISVSNTNIDFDATALLPYLQLPIAVIPSGKFSLIIENASQGTPYCGELEGYIVWHEAKVDTAMGSIDFATPSMDFSCSEGRVVALLKQHSEQLTTNAKIQLMQDARYQLKGSIIGREGLEPSILQALSWIGPKNSAGEIALNFAGKL